MRLRCFLTSRPELLIRMQFANMAITEFKVLVLHEVLRSNIEDDIHLFLNNRLSRLRTDRDMPIDWPRSTIMQKLVAMSVPLFIFAATICRIFEDPFWNPEESLNEILTHQNQGSQLDHTYLPVLDRLFRGQTDKKKRDQLVHEFQQIVGALVMLESPLSVVSLAKLINLPERRVQLRLNLLRSVLNLPDNNTLPVRILHLSFRDFLVDPETREKAPFWVDEKEMHYILTTRCLLLCEMLERNMCGLNNATSRADIDRRTIDQCLRPELQYACRYWARHLVQSKDIDVLMQQALSFLQIHLLHWLEAMCILGYVSDIVAIINHLQMALGRVSPVDSPVDKLSLMNTGEKPKFRNI